MSEKNSKQYKPIQIDINDQNAWDDTLLIKAYDESILLAKEDVAKGIANATNLKTTKKTPKNQNEEVTYQAGDYVRATYTDGKDYEAKIVALIDDQKMCLLKYLGYNNEEFVNVSDLIPSWGKSARKQQCVDAQKDKNVFIDTSESEDIPIPTVTEHHSDQRSRNYKFESRGNNQYMPVPPPPPLPPTLDTSEDAEHLSAMLMSWYMSGYYTGLYQGQKMAKSRSNNV